MVTKWEKKIKKEKGKKSGKVKECVVTTFGENGQNANEIVAELSRQTHQSQVCNANVSTVSIAGWPVAEFDVRERDKVSAVVGPR